MKMQGLWSEDAAFSRFLKPDAPSPNLSGSRSGIVTKTGDLFNDYVSSSLFCVK
jgi:hypothetical protein